MRKGSLRRRFAMWTALAILGSIAVYAAVVFVLFNREKAEIQRGEESIEESSADEVVDALLLAGPVALAGGLAAAWALSRRALAPIDDVVAEASALTAHDLHRRLPVPARDDELRDLIVSLNGLLGRLEEGFGALARQAAEASHELRTPLTVIATDLEVALRRPRTAEEWHDVGARTLGEVRRLAGLVDALLELSRAGAAAAAGGVVDLGTIAEQVCGGLAGAADARGIALELGGLAHAAVRGHGGALEGALRNLIGNALRFTPTGGRVAVAIEDGAGRVRVHVDDSGPGLAPDERDAVFEPFRRGSAAAGVTGHDASGVGLGLAIVRKVVAAHDGTVVATDSPLGGARFTITLPSAAS